MQLNVLNDLAKAKRRWTEKKIHNPLSCHRARQKANTNPKTNKTDKNTKKQTTQTRDKNKNQHGRWSADQFIDNWKMQEEMITLYHLRDWYGNVKHIN